MSYKSMPVNFDQWCFHLGWSFEWLPFTIFIHL